MSECSEVDKCGGVCCDMWKCFQSGVGCVALQGCGAGILSLRERLRGVGRGGVCWNV